MFPLLVRRPFTGIPVVAASKGEIVNAILSTAFTGAENGCDVHLLEANGIAAADVSAKFEKLLIDACLVIPDGRWLELLTRSSPVPLLQCRGEALFRKLLDLGRKNELRHFFVGATEEKLQRLLKLVEREYPGVLVAGHWAPPFRDLTPAEELFLHEKIIDAQPHIVWLGISTPKQDWEAVRVAKTTKKVVIAVGAAFEFVSGDKKSAPLWVVRFGAEWLFRLLSEPRRLAKRYAVGIFVFARRVFRYRREDVLAP